MNHIRRFFTLLLMAAVCLAARTHNDNVIIEDNTVTYTLKARDGRLATVSVNDRTTFLAQRSDDLALALTFYNDDITIDKASAPGAKPIYRAWEDDDMFYTGSRVCALPVELRQGKPATAVFRQTYRTPEQFCQIVLCPLYFARHTRHTVIVPTELADDIHLTPLNLPDSVALQQSTDSDGNRVYTVELSDVPALRPQRMAPAADAAAPQIIVSGYFASLPDLYRFLNSKTSAAPPSEAVSQMARDITRGMTDDRLKADSIAAWVRDNIRYVAVEHGEYGMQPDEADAVLSKRYGDCKGSANLIRTMLQAVGIDGRLVWIGTRGDVPHNWTDMPTIAAGNHMIAAAVLPDTTMFLDGTARFLPRGVSPGAIAGRQCLVQNGDSYIIDTVPAQPAETNRCTLSGRFSLDGKKLHGCLQQTYSGIERRWLEGMMAEAGTARRTEFLKTLLAYGRKSAVVDSITVSTAATNAFTSTVSYCEDDPSALRAASGGKTYVLMRPLRDFAYNKVETKGRTMPLVCGIPVMYAAQLSLVIPDGYSIADMPQAVTFDSPYFAGKITYTDDNGTVYCSAELRILRTDIPVDEIPAWNDAVRAIRRAATAPVILIAAQ